VVEVEVHASVLSNERDVPAADLSEMKAYPMALSCGKQLCSYFVNMIFFFSKHSPKKIKNKIK